MTTKIILDIVIPGGQMVSNAELKKASKEDKRNLTEHSFVNIVRKTKGAKPEIETLHVFTRKTIPAHQTIKITNEAYSYMTSQLEVPADMKASIWKQMSINQRLKFHLDKYCYDLNGISYTYQILPD